MTRGTALYGATIFDGETRHEGAALLIADGAVAGLCPAADIPADVTLTRLPGGLIAPGFIDLQANGGGGVLFNAEPTLGGIGAICRAHARHGTTALLVTLITDTPEIMARAIAAGAQAHARGLPGFLGLHLEGPHLSLARRGAHHPGLTRPMTDRDVDVLREARAALPHLMVTLAPEAVDDAQIAALVAAGIRVSLGHTDVGIERARSAFAAGASCVTHLFNAMSGLGHREPGLVGALLDTGDAFAGLIADGHHVAPTAIRVALRAKAPGAGRVFLVTDAMSTIGTDMTEFTLNGRRILRRDGRLTLEDGTLAGADLDMGAAVAFMAGNTDLARDEVLRMASLYPALCMGLGAARGRLAPGAAADIVHLGDDLCVRGVWIAGEPVAA